MTLLEFQIGCDKSCTNVQRSIPNATFCSITLWIDFGPSRGRYGSRAEGSWDRGSERDSKVSMGRRGRWANGPGLEVEGPEGPRVDGRVVDGSTGVQGSKGPGSKGSKGSKGSRGRAIDGVEGSTGAEGVKGVRLHTPLQKVILPYITRTFQSAVHPTPAPYIPHHLFFCVLATQWSTANPRIIKRARLCTQIHMQGRHAPN